MPQSERHALVVGGGTMGVGIIAMFLGGGWKVDVVSRSASTRDGLAAARAALAAWANPRHVGLTTFATLPEAEWQKIDIVGRDGDRRSGAEARLFAEMETLAQPGAR